MKSLFALIAAVCAFAVVTPTSAEAGLLGIRLGVGAGHQCAPHYGGAYYRGTPLVRGYPGSYYGQSYGRVYYNPRPCYSGSGYYGYGGYPSVRYVYPRYSGVRHIYGGYSGHGHYGHGTHYGYGGRYRGARHCR